MKDIFISHSSQDQTMTEEICSWLESKGLTCWVSFRPQDLPPGKDYTVRITQAIDRSRIFVILLSNYSVASDQVRQEIIAANDRQRFGLRIFPIIIDDTLDMEQFHAHFGYVLSGKENVSWADISAREVLLQQLLLCLNARVTDESADLLSTMPAPINLIGRESEMEQLKIALREFGKVCITGIGGIGKTALIQAFCYAEKDEYKTVIYLSNDRCLLRTLDNDKQLQLHHPDLEARRRDSSDYEYAMFKLALLENSVDSRTLLIIDNLDSGHDPLLERICALNCSLIIASRNMMIQRNNFGHVRVEELENQTQIRELFEQNYGSRLTDDEVPALAQLLSGVNRHTMTIILLAKQMRYLEKRPGDYQTRSQLRAERAENIKEIIGASDDPGLIAMYAQLFEMFSAGTLTADEKTVMKTMCLVPMEGINRHLYISLLGDSVIPTVTRLEELGWLQYSSEQAIIMVHPLVRDVVIHELGIHLDDPDISTFLSSFIKSVSNSWNNSYADNIRFKELAMSIYYQFPVPTIARYKDYLILSKYLWVVNCIDTSLEIQNRVKEMFIGSDGKHANSPEEAEALLQIGFTYQGKGDSITAASELEAAAAIYGNKFAATISHLAQAYMTAASKSIEEIEPLLQQSLEIRRKYWPDTVSEAAACHLYAKTLSAYERNLSYALQLEKKSYSIFSRLQPESANVSSAAYILGWLFVQTAEDEDDIEYGIKKLEEAKNLRLKHRGDILHPWMEDIYLKLGLAYERAGNDRQAVEYYKLLLSVRERKYDDPFHRNTVEVYQLLQNVYERLGDDENRKKCKRYLRYHS